jgi:hypothetical protein
MTKKILFILCNDYGELLIADYFADGQPFKAFALCPTKLHSTYDHSVLTIAPFRHAGDIYNALNQFRPDLVILASGYLLTLHNLLTLAELEQLLAHLSNAGIPCATTDPWMQSWQEHRAAMAANEIKQLLQHPFQSLQLNLETLLRHTIHLYSVPFKTNKIPTVGFFNPDAFKQWKFLPGPRNQHQHWLFVLAGMDANGLLARHGVQLLDHLRLRFREILQDPNTKISLLGPPDFVTALKQIVADLDRVTLIPFCTFSQFQRLTFDSTVAVYWNCLSASILYHLHKNSMMVFADRGHMLNACPPLARHVAEDVLNQVQPTTLDLTKPLEPNHLLQKAFGVQQQMQKEIYPTYEAMLRPTEVVEYILNRKDD